MFVAAFNNEDPGVQTTSLSYFGLPIDIAATSFNNIDLTELSNNLVKNPALGILECQRRCGII
jgi:hypothetical protein